MKDIGIRTLKAQASEVVRHVAEDHATYTITRHGRPVGILGPADFPEPAERAVSEKAWEGLLGIADRIARQGRRRRSAVRELERMRR